MDQLKEIIKARPSRRTFLAGVSAAGAAAVAVGCGSQSIVTTTPSPTAAPAPVTNDFDVLNFALNLEYLEAEFYLRAATGSGIPAANIGANPGSVTGGTQVPFTADQLVLQQYANEIAQDELDHVLYLRAAISSLGGTPVDRPTIDFTAFAALGTLAGISGTFNPFADPYSFLVGAFVFEDVGVTAYHGAAPLIADKMHVLPAAASILAVEAYHAAEIRTLIAGMAAQSGASQTYLSDANAISNVRASVGGGNETALGTSSIVAANATTSIAWQRTTDQVLHVVYASGPGVVSSGGFFPKGLNGTITTTRT